MLVGELSARQVCALRRDGLTVEEIARGLGITEAEVQLVLERNGDNSQAADRDINDGQLAALREKALQLALYSEEDSVSARMTMFLIERDKPRAVKESGNSIQLIQNAIITANENFKKLVAEYSTEPEMADPKGQQSPSLVRRPYDAS